MADRFLKSITFPDLANKYIIADTSLSVSGAGADSKTVGDKLKEASAGIENLVTASAVQTLENKVPYLFRQTPNAGHNEFDTIVGGTVAFNQLVYVDENGTSAGVTISTDSDHKTVTINGTTTSTLYLPLTARLGYTSLINHVYLCDKGTSASSNCYIYNDNGGVSPSDMVRATYIGKATAERAFYIRSESGNTFNNVSITPQIFDLTQMFGSTVADYIYSLETATAGAGVAYFKSLGFDKPYYAYNAGELVSVSGLQSHDTVGFNQFDKSTVVNNKVWTDNGEITANEYAHSDYIRVLPNTMYYTNGSAVGYYYTVCFFDAEKNLIGDNRADRPDADAGTFTTSANTCFAIVNTRKDQTAVDDLVFNISSSKNGTYEPYNGHSYSLDSTLTLRGVPKLDASNNVYYDGDVYEADGTVTRKYGVIDLSTLTWSTVSGTVKYAQISAGQKEAGLAISEKYQVLTSWGAFQDSSNTTPSVFVGETAFFTNNVDAPSGLAVYELASPTTETADPYTANQICDGSGTEEHVSTSIVPVGHDTKYPITLSDIMPTASGNYVLKCTVTGGVATYEWVSES